MAKKNYTPEEMQAKAEKKAANCKIFFGTFTKALAVFLAVVIAWSLVTIAFTAPITLSVFVRRDVLMVSDFGRSPFGFRIVEAKIIFIEVPIVCENAL